MYSFVLGNESVLSNEVSMAFLLLHPFLPYKRHNGEAAFHSIFHGYQTFSNHKSCFASFWH